MSAAAARQSERIRNADRWIHLLIVPAVLVVGAAVYLLRTNLTPWRTITATIIGKPRLVPGLIHVGGQGIRGSHPMHEYASPDQFYEVTIRLDRGEQVVRVPEDEYQKLDDGNITVRFKRAPDGSLIIGRIID